MLTRRDLPQISNQNPPSKVEEKKEGKISLESKNLIASYEALEREIALEQNLVRIKVGSTLSSLAFFYERVRNSIDYKQEHVQLRASIERILKRLLWENPSRALNTKGLSSSLIKELIWARYLKNNELPEKRTEEITRILDRSLAFLALFSTRKEKIMGISMRDYILGITSGEIEEIVKPRFIMGDILTEQVFAWFFKRFEWKNTVAEIDKKVHIWASIYRSLFKSDMTTTRYHLIRRFYPTWMQTNKGGVKEIKNDFILVATNLEKIISSPMHLKVLRIIQKITPSFLILLEIIQNEGGDILEDEKRLSEKIGEYTESKYEEIKGRIARGITRSVIYIFVTKIIFAIIIEVPYEMFILGGFRLIPIAINLTLPPTLMVFIGLLIKRPGANNTKKIEDWIYDFVYMEKQDRINFQVNEKRQKGLGYKVFTYFYLLLFITIFGSISYFLYQLHFSVVSAFIFFSFISLVLLFGYKVKNTASEFNVVGEDEGLIGNMVSIIFLPFINVGSWLSGKLAKINILMLFLDFLIEAPLKNILAILQDWSAYIKEKKDEFVDVPNN